MLSSDIIRDGDLQGALKSLIDQIRKNPSDTKLRTFLFQLYCVLGQWEKALNQLEALEQLDVTLWPMTKSYREIIRCELFRAEVFAGVRTPLIFGEPKQWIAWIIEALSLDVRGQHQAAIELRRQALELADSVPGQIDGESFAWLADADSRLGPLLEVMVNGRYYWVPFERIQNIDVSPPEDLRDLVWVPAQIVWINEGSSSTFIPSRYVGSENANDSAIALARRTEWREASADTFHGIGQRVFTTDTKDFAVLDVRRIQFAGHE